MKLGRKDRPAPFYTPFLSRVTMTSSTPYKVLSHHDRSGRAPPPRAHTLLYKYPLFPESWPVMQKGPVSRPSRRRRRKRRSLGTMPKLQDYTVYTPDNQIADLAERQRMTVHLIDGPTQHVLREAHTVYLFGSYTPLRDMSETEHVTELASSLGKELLLCDVTTGQWYERAPSDQTFTTLSTSTFPVLHQRSAVLGIRSLPLHHMQLKVTSWGVDLGVG